MEVIGAILANFPYVSLQGWKSFINKVWSFIIDVSTLLFPLILISFLSFSSKFIYCVVFTPEY